MQNRQALVLGVGLAPSGTAFGTGTAGSAVFGFGTGTPAQAGGTGTSGSFGGGFGSGFGSGFGQSASGTGAVTFGFGSQAVTFGTFADSAVAKQRSWARNASTIAMFRSSSDAKAFGRGTAGAGSVFLGFSADTPAQSSGTGTSVLVVVAWAEALVAAFSNSPAAWAPSPWAWAVKSSSDLITAADAAGASTKMKELDELPDFTTEKVLVGDAFVHGSGECYQLGLGDDPRECKKPSLLKSAIGQSMCEIAVGAINRGSLRRWTIPLQPERAVLSGC